MAVQEQDLAGRAPAQAWQGRGGGQRGRQTGIQMGLRMGLRTRSRWDQGGLRVEMGTTGGQHEMRAGCGSYVPAEDPMSPLRSPSSPRPCMWLKKTPRGHIGCVKSPQEKTPLTQGLEDRKAPAAARRTQVGRHGELPSHGNEHFHEHNTFSGFVVTFAELLVLGVRRQLK